MLVAAWAEDDQGGRYAEVNAIFREAKGLDASDLVNSLDFSRSSPEIKAFFYSLIPEKNR